MILYYGADKLIIRPIYNYGNPSNDYGLGLYLTPDYNMAKLWASKFSNGGYAIKYSLDFNNLKILNLTNNTEEDILIWITILINHRFDTREKIKYKDRIDKLNKKYHINLDDYDVIIGYRADDSYFQYSRDFIAGNLSLEKLSEAMILGELGKQIVLKSKKAFNNIMYIDSCKIEKTNVYEEFRLNVLRKYHLLKNSDSDSNTFIRDILRRI